MCNLITEQHKTCCYFRAFINLREFINHPEFYYKYSEYCENMMTVDRNISLQVTHFQVFTLQTGKIIFKPKKSQLASDTLNFHNFYNT